MRQNSVVPMEGRSTKGRDSGSRAALVIRLPAEVATKVEESRARLFRVLRKLLIQRLPDDVRKVMGENDRLSLSPESLDRAPTWQELRTIANDTADQLAGFAARFVSRSHRLRWIEERLDEYHAEIIGDRWLESHPAMSGTDRCVIDLASLVLLERRGIGTDRSRRILEDKVREAIVGAKSQALLKLQDIESSNSVRRSNHGAKSAPRKLTGPIDKRKVLIAKMKAQFPGIKARAICVEFDRVIERASPVSRQALAPLDSWIKKAGGKRGWVDLYENSGTRRLVRAFINKVPALRTRIES